MLDRLINRHMPVVAVLNDKSVSKKGDPSLDLTTHQWILAEDLVSTLKPFESATHLLSSEKNVSISAVLPIIHGLWKGVIVNTKDSKPIKAMKRILLAQLEDRYCWRLWMRTAFQCLHLSWILDLRALLSLMQTKTKQLFKQKW